MPTMNDYRRLRCDCEVLSDERRAKVSEYQSQFTAEVRAEWARVHGKRRKFPKDWRKVETLANYQAIHAKYQDAGLQWLADWKSRRDQLEAELNGLAQLVEPETLPDGVELIQVDWVYSGAYRSQGFGAMKYTREAAQSRADKGTHYGLKMEIRLIGEPTSCGYGITLQDYGIFANTDADGWDIITRRPGVPLKEWIKGCWKRGVNPRVYDPFLPYGIEERLGLDYLGG